MTADQQLRRFICVLRTDSMGESAEMKEHPGGAYVLYSDVKHLLARESADDFAREHDPVFEGLLTSHGAAIAKWSAGNGSREDAQAARDAVRAHFYRRALDVKGDE